MIVAALSYLAALLAPFDRARAAEPPSLGLAEIRARDFAEIASFEGALTARDSELALLERSAGELTEHACGGAKGRHSSVCHELLSRVSASQARVKSIQADINVHRKNLHDYLAAKAQDDLARALRARLEQQSNATASSPGHGADASSLEEALACIVETRRWDAPFSELYSDALALLKTIDARAAFDWLRKTPGYRSRQCPVAGSIAGTIDECWENDNGHIAYRARGGIRIDAGCIVHSGDWSQFPADPAVYLRTAEQAALRGPSCLDGLDKDTAGEYRDALKADPPLRIVCAKSDGVIERECAHTVHGDRALVLTGPNPCGRLDNTIFHELLHAGTRLDDMTAIHHNDPQCRPYDAIYACSELCFPSAPTLLKAGISWYGCNACARDDGAADRRCASLPTEIDQGYINCHPRPR